MRRNFTVPGGVVEGGVQHDIHSPSIGIRYETGEGLHGSCSIGGGGTAPVVGGGHQFVDLEEIFHCIGRPRVIGRSVEDFPPLDTVGMDGLEPKGVDAHVAQGG